MKNIIFFPDNFHFLVVKFSVYLNRFVFVMTLKQELSGTKAYREISEEWKSVVSATATI